MDIYNKIISKLPYYKDFLFVDRIIDVDENSISGNYTFKADSPIYKSHFKHKAQTPGTLLIEAMGQIGMVAHIIFIEKLYDSDSTITPILSNVEASFFKEVIPNDKILVKSEKIYYKSGILKSKVSLYDSIGDECVFCIAQIKLKNE